VRLSLELRNCFVRGPFEIPGERTEPTRRCGNSIAAIMADGNPAPIVANALSSSNVFATRVR
jgi:hypothetical protein